jgi:hypothetical protein
MAHPAFFFFTLVQTSSSSQFFTLQFRPFTSSVFFFFFFFSSSSSALHSIQPYTQNHSITLWPNRPSSLTTLTDFVFLCFTTNLVISEADGAKEADG